MFRKVGTGNQNNWLNTNTRSSITFYLAFAAFLISMFSVFPQILVSFKVDTWNVSEWIYFLQLIVIVVSAYIAFSTISTSKSTARERATLDTILDDNKDEELYDAKILVHDFHKNPQAYFNSKNDSTSTRTTLAQLFTVDGSQLTPAEHEVRKALIKALNRYEFYAVGINCGLFDEQLFKRMHCSNILRLWETSDTAVTQLRNFTKIDTLFKDLEVLAVRWKTKSLRSSDIK